VAALSSYCQEPFIIEEVEVFYEQEQRSDITPKFKENIINVNIKNI
jgi:hypothetical protein